jgi:CRISPR-associated protein Cas5 subtype I-B
MKVLKFDVEIPYWCSFKQFGTVNIQQTYPFPPPPTIFGMIQNALGKLQKDYNGFEKLNFAIIVRNESEKLDDYSNIMKGNREQKSSRSALRDELSSKFKDVEKQLKKEGLNEEKINEKKKEYERRFWDEKRNKLGAYAIEKIWMKTQVTRQKLINPKYSIFLKSHDNAEHSLKNISEALRYPKRPLYLGESDDFVIINMNKDGIMDAGNKEMQSSQIKSVIPGIHMNSHVVKIPNTTREQENTAKEGSIIVSIPKGDIGKPISCYEIDGENIVFL